MKTPKVSIIIATYNSGETLKDTLNSVCTQKYDNWECIVVDGASKDQTLNVVKDFEKKNSKIRHLSEPDRGIYDAFNKGWKNAKGEWIYYLGSSDLLLPDALEKLMAEEHRAAIVSGHVYAKMIDGTLKPGYSKGFSGSHQAKLMRRSIISQFGGFDESYKIIADEDLIWKIKNSRYEVDIVDVFVAIFTMGGISSKYSSLLTVAEEHYRIMKKYPNLVKYPLYRVTKIYIHGLGSIIYRQIRKFFITP